MPLLTLLLTAALGQSPARVVTDGGAVVISTVNDLFLEVDDGTRVGVTAALSSQQSTIDALSAVASVAQASIEQLHSQIAELRNGQTSLGDAVGAVRGDVSTAAVASSTAIATVSSATSDAIAAIRTEAEARANATRLLNASIGATIASVAEQTRRNYFLRFSGSQTLSNFGGGWQMNCGGWSRFDRVAYVRSGVRYSSRSNSLERSLLTYMDRQTQHLMNSFYIWKVTVHEGRGNNWICPWRRTPLWQHSEDMWLTSAAFTRITRLGSVPPRGYYLNGHRNQLNRWKLTGSHISGGGRGPGGYSHLHPQCRGCEFYIALPATVMGKFDLDHPDAGKRWWFFPTIPSGQQGF